MKGLFIPALLILTIILTAGPVLGESAVAASDSSDPGSRDQQSADGKGRVYVVLESGNAYTDTFEHGQFARAGNSGAGTGPFVGKGFEFSKGACDNGYAGPAPERRRWRPHTLGCSRPLLDADWCARKRADPTVQYTLHFLAWTSGPEGRGRRCQGRCEETDHRTAYIRTRVP